MVWGERSKGRKKGSETELKEAERFKNVEEDPELREERLTRKDEKKFKRERSTTTREQGKCFTLRETTCQKVKLL